MVRYSFPVRLFHSLLQAGLSRRSSVPGFLKCLLYPREHDQWCWKYPDALKDAGLPVPEKTSLS